MEFKRSWRQHMSNAVNIPLCYIKIFLPNCTRS